ncbi:MAG: 5'/3'-nucleotidase SurE [Ignavibacteriae bacterium]|nr:5'/3'-nucleotidase SurE [Ignavibacteriota bacterium]
MMNKKSLILVSNDDGIESDGIKALMNAMRKIGEVIVVAPNSQQSAVGHAVTVASPIRVYKNLLDKDFYGYAIDGTPADSVKFAVRTLLKGRKIDLLVSGINHGSNTAINIIYSGTVSAATEGTILGIPSIAFSLTSYTSKTFEPAANFAKKLARTVLKNGLPKGTLLNVNIPPLPESKIKGVVVTKQGKSFWDDRYERRLDPNKREYYWLTGRMAKLDKTIEFDQKAVDSGYISVSPIKYDLTDYGTYEKMQDWKLKL